MEVTIVSREYSEKIKGINVLITSILYFIFILVRSEIIPNAYLKIIMEIISLIFIIVYLKKIGEINIKNIFKKINLKYILLSVIALRIVAIGGTFLGESVIGIQKTLNDSYAINILNNLKGINLVEYSFYLFWIIIVEEFIFRYVIIGNIGNMSKLSMVISSIIFSCFHLSNNIIHWITYFSMSMIWSILYYKTKGTDVSIVSHILNDALGYTHYFL